MENFTDADVSFSNFLLNIRQSLKNKERLPFWLRNTDMYINNLDSVIECLQAHMHERMVQCGICTPTFIQHPTGIPEMTFLSAQFDCQNCSKYSWCRFVNCHPDSPSALVLFMASWAEYVLQPDDTKRKSAIHYLDSLLRQMHNTNPNGYKM